jgi:hypothetical protein
MLVPAWQVGAHRTAGPVLQNEPPDGGVSGGVACSPWWPSDAMGSAQAAAAIRYMYTRTASVRFLLSAHLWEATSLLVKVLFIAGFGPIVHETQ